MQRYNPTDIEPKWQQIWRDDQRYKTSDSSDKPKYYITNMFPYPSGIGMHVGHIFEYAIIDAYTRFRRTQNNNVMYPMGFDNFGLPAENYAIKTGVSPQESIATNVEKFKEQIARVGVSIDWSREVQTSDPSYYKWTQWIFAQLFERGLAYQKEAQQWWCDIDQTVLANEQVVNGKCWRHDGENDPLATKKSIKQWFFKITDYADALLQEIPDLDWPDKIKTAQTNWIGKSQGAEVEFAIDGREESLRIFTTRPDTIFGATFMVVAPEHPLAKTLTTDQTKPAVESYIEAAIKKSEIERGSEGKEKTGVFTGSYAINPATGKTIPIWIADYVLGGYGTGAIMAVPAHDERDLEFAEAFDLPVVQVVQSAKDDEVIVREGALMNSGAFDGMPTSQAREEVVAWLEQQGVGKATTTYKMRDWLISRQRYWGAPIPIIHCDEHGAVAVPDNELPVLLPDIEDFAPKGDGKSPLARVNDWVNTTCPTCKKPAKRETDVMDGYACSSWYLLRYTDPQNPEQAWSPKRADYWNPIDMYVGGDHAVAHLLYVRFWNHVFYDMGLVPTKEPVKQLVYHGLIQAEDGTKMSKSKGNVVDPLEVIDAGYGADALRTFELFLGPINENSNWSSKGIAGVYRFLNRFWTLVQEYIDAEASSADSTDTKQLQTITNQTIKKVTEDIHRLSFNTAIAALMECTNQLYKLKTSGFSAAWKPELEALIQLLQPFAPHMSAELWQQLGHDSQLDFEPWPTWDEAKLVQDTMTIIVQVNGKLRAKLELAKNMPEDDIKQAALGDEKIATILNGKTPTKIIYVPGRLVSIVE